MSGWTLTAAGVIGGLWLPGPDAAPAEALAWLEGCWQTEAGATREVWTRGADTLLFGFNVATRNGEEVFFEHLRLEHDGTGWTFVAYPGGGTPTAFSMTAHESASATFINPDHDFPQRLHYARSDDRLEAEASRSDGSDARRWSFTPCPATAAP